MFKTYTLIAYAFILILSFTYYSCGVDASAKQFDKIKGSNSISLMNKFLQDFPKSERAAEVLKIRNQLVFDSIKGLNTVEAYNDFIKNYPKSEQIAIAKEKITELQQVQAVISTFRGNAQRNYYGNKCPARLDEIWTTNMGSGRSYAYGKMYVWTGAGWTGQPLVVTENDKTYIVQGCFDYNVKKIDAQNGKIIWKYKFDDIIKGTGSIYINRKAAKKDEQVVIMQGSRRGEGVRRDAGITPSFRGISYYSGKELWRMNSKKTPSYSRDVDASAAILGDTAYIGLENGIFTVFDPNAANLVERDGIMQPKLYDEVQMWNSTDIQKHGGNLVAESSPTIFNGRVYIVSGSGHVYGYNLQSKKIDWDFYIGCDMDGSAPVSKDSCLLVSVEKEYIKGQGGVFKLDPSKPEAEAAQWYFPVKNRKFAFWQGGIIGSVAINDEYIDENDTHLAAFLAIDGYLYVVDHKNITNEQAIGPDGTTKYYKPKLVFKQYVGASISSPIITDDKLVACTYEGIFLFEYDKDLNFKLLEQKKGISFEASPICWDNRIYVVSNTTGLMYCFGEK